MTWTKEKKKQKSSIKLKEVQPFNLFISGFGGLGKFHLIKTTGIASINISGAAVHSVLGLQCHGKLFPLDSNMLCAFKKDM